ncbi:MAG TPA: hypothetical protein VLK65_01670 [Vicinamibacteria bacterium]|nr:hypothetical protein [Vicinamibacteria bacterium]
MIGPTLSHAIAVGHHVNHHRGVLAVLKPDGAGGFTVEELDREPNSIFHDGAFEKETLVTFTDALGRFTWNVVPDPVANLPLP